MTDTTPEQFTNAVKYNEYAEHVINQDPELILITDVDSEPYIICSETYQESLVDDIINELDWMICKGIEFDKANTERLNSNVKVFHIYGYETR